MFTRSRSGRRASPGRLNVEHLEDRFLPHGSLLAAGFVGPSPTGPSLADTRFDHARLDVFARLDVAAHQARQAEHGPVADLGHGEARGGDAGGRSAQPDDSSGGSSSDGPSHGSSTNPFLVMGRFAERALAALSDVQPAFGDTGEEEALGKTAKKDHNTSKDDDSTSEGSGRGTIIGRGRPAASEVTPAAAERAGADESDASAAAGKRVAVVPGPVGPLPSAAGTSDDNGPSQAPARPATTAAAVPVVPVRVAGPSAAGQDGGDEGGPEAVPAEVAAGSAVVLAGPDLRAAALAAHGQAGPADDVLVAPVAADVRLVRDGTLAEGAALDGDAPAAAPASYAALVGGSVPGAFALLDRLALDTHALDAALQGFLRGLDRLGEQLSDPRARLGVSAWLLGGAAALAALEVNRRRRAAAVNADGVPLTWLDPEGPAPEPAS
jgi:hypothetical protein